MATTDPAYALQAYIYTTLSGAGLQVYDRVPSSAAFPFVQIGDDHIMTDAQHADRGWTECHSTIHVFSRAVGKPEVKQIAGQIKDLLNVRPNMPGFYVWQWTHEDTLYKAEPDGLTSHAIIQFTFRVQPGVIQSTPAPPPPAPPTLPNFAAKLAAVRAGTHGSRAIWGMVGDSLTAGWGAAGQGGGANNQGTAGAAGVYSRAKAFPAETAKALVAAGVPARADAFFGTGRTANNTASEAVAANPNLTLGSDWNIYTDYPSIGGPFYHGGPTTPMVFTPSAAADSFDIYYVTGAGFATFNVSDNSGVLATVNGDGTPGLTKATVTRATASTNPISISFANGGALYFIVGIAPFNSTSPAVEVWNMGWAGAATTDWVASAQAWSAINALKSVALDLLSVELGANDSNYGVTAAVYGVNMQTIINAVRQAAPTSDVLLIKCNAAQDSHNITPYLPTIDGLASTYGPTPALDFFDDADITVADHFDAVHLVESGYAKEAALASAMVISRTA